MCSQQIYGLCFLGGIVLLCKLISWGWRKWLEGTKNLLIVLGLLVASAQAEFTAPDSQRLIDIAVSIELVRDSLEVLSIGAKVPDAAAVGSDETSTVLGEMQAIRRALNFSAVGIFAMLGWSVASRMLPRR